MKLKTIPLLLLTLVAFSVSANKHAALLGEWFTSDKGAKVKIYQCGDKICGKITWLEDPNGDDGKPLRDDNNPEEELQDRPILGLDILHGFEKTDDNLWEEGKIYDPENGKTYSCKMTLEGDKLKVRGFIGFSFMGRTEVWTRAN